MVVDRRIEAARRRAIRFRALGACLLIAALPLLSCSSSDPHSLCQSVFHSKTSPATGVVIAAGNFAQGESILLQVPINGQTQTFVGTTSPDGTHATFTGIPTGHYDQVTWVASCKDGEMTLFANGTLDVM